MDLRNGATILFFIICYVSQFIHGARILVFSQLMSSSHYSVFVPIMEELARRGHHIVVVTTNPLNYTTSKFPNITEVDLSHTTSKTLRKDIAEHDIPSAMFIITFQNFWQQIQDPVTREMLFKEKFDLYFFDISSPLNVVVGELLNVPSIGLVTFCGTTNIWHITGNPTHPLLYGDTNIINDGRLNLYERIKNVFIYLDFSLRFYWHSNDYQEKLTKLSGRDISSIVNPSKFVDLLFVNMFPVLAGNRPLSSTTVLLGGLHLRPRKSLSHELKKYLDKSKNGVIYFSLGTFVLSKNLPLEKRKLLLDLFSELPYNVLWKFEDGYIDNLPSNVYVSSFFPQYDIFGHPNIKLFITHGGLQSMEEAIFSGVPMLTMPFHWDQHRNAKLVEKHGIGETMIFNDITKESLKSKINSIIGNYKYKKNIKKLAQLLNDEPLTSLEKAIWWTEYVLRHGGTKHLRPKVVDLPTYQYYMLDVVIFLAIVSVIIILSIRQMCILVIKFFKMIIKSKSQKYKKS